MMFSVLITGASSGIGLAAARRLNRAGWQVFAGHLPEESPLWPEAGLIPIPVDITRDDLVAEAAQQIEAQLAGRGLNALVNNAGIFTLGPLEAIPLEGLYRQFEVNLFGHIRMTRAVLPLIRQAQKNRRIVNVTSMAGRLVTPYFGAYGMSKHALEGFTDALRQELSPWQIHVCAVEPGNVRTPLVEAIPGQFLQFWEGLSPQMQQPYEDRFKVLMQNWKLERPGSSTPEQIAAVIYRALADPRPRARYRAGFDARLMLTLQGWLPARWMDALMARALGLR